MRLPRDGLRLSNNISAGLRVVRDGYNMRDSRRIAWAWSSNKKGSDMGIQRVRKTAINQTRSCLDSYVLAFIFPTNLLMNFYTNFYKFFPTYFLKRTHGLHLEQSIMIGPLFTVKFLRGPAGSLSGMTPHLLLSLDFARWTQRRCLTLLRMGSDVDRILNPVRVRPALENYAPSRHPDRYGTYLSRE